MECFAFGGATVRFASLETSFNAANHTIPPPTSHEGHPHCTKDKNRSPFHGEKPRMIKWFLGKKRNQIFQSPKTILHGRDAILRVCAKRLIFNMVLKSWSDVKYHVPTGFGFSPKAIQAFAWNQTCRSTNGRCQALASLKGCFLCFLFQSPSIYPQNHLIH